MSELCFRNPSRGRKRRLRFVAGFPVSSGVYIGEVERYTLLNLNTNYAFPTAPGVQLNLTVQNLLNDKHQAFVGTPTIGRLALVRLTYAF